MSIIFLCVLGVLLIALPLAAPALGAPLGGAAAALATLSGIALLVAAASALIVTKLYRRTKASDAFVRTGAGGVRVIRDGGALVIPVLHELVPVSLQTLKLEVSRVNEDALITQDKLRADIHAEFYVRVQPEHESILQASRSLGDKMGDPTKVKDVVGDKLVSALRTAAASKTLEQLNSERDEFLAEVMKLVTEDLRSNGLILESVTISKLDQTDERYLKDENIFDAQGRRKIAEITQLNLTERNRLLRDGERARKHQDVEAVERVLELDRHRREAEARQKAEVAKVDAETEREAREKRVDAERRVSLAEIEKARALEVAVRAQQESIELAERQKQERIAEAERKRAAAEQALAEAEAEREQARQRIETIRVTEAAEREKRRQVVEAQAAAEQHYVSEQRRADGEAYALQKQAEARRAAANAEAEAIRTRSEAEAEAERQRALGQKATAMVPVDVARAQVDVERDRLSTVVRPELEVREEHGKVAQDFELAKLRIEAEKEVRIAVARASATLFAKVQANLYGTPEDVTKVAAALTRGQALAEGVGGFLGSADGRTLRVIEGISDGLTEVLRSVGQARQTTPATEAVRRDAVLPSAQNGQDGASSADTKAE